jgi:hypothetical protein
MPCRKPVQPCQAACPMIDTPARTGHFWAIYELPTPHRRGHHHTGSFGTTPRAGRGDQL